MGKRQPGPRGRERKLGDAQAPEFDATNYCAIAVYNMPSSQTLEPGERVERASRF